MTILPKKKTSERKTDAEISESSSHHGGSHHNHSHQLTVPNAQTSSSLGRDRLYVAGQSSPSSWPAHTSPPHYEETVEPTPTHNKRRHRASPHRSVRSKHRDHRERNADHTIHPTSHPSTPSTSVGCSSPVPGPSSAMGSNVVLEDSSGYNSGDEYGYGRGRGRWDLNEDEWNEREQWFETKLKKKNLIIKTVGEDGACLFRSVADQVYGDEEMHHIIRKHCMDYIAANADYFSQYITEDFTTYVSRKRLDRVHGNHVEIQALSEMYNRSIEVYCYTTEPINIFHGAQQSDNEPIRLSYHRGVHYNSIINPYKATIGVGLGLPGLHPGSADKNLMTDAIRQSENFQLEQTMLEDKMRATDWEATNEAIEEQVARESYLQWLRDNEKRNKAQSRSSTATSTSTSASSSADIRSPRHWGSAATTPTRSTNSPKTSPRTQTPPVMSPKAEAAAAVSLPGPSHHLGFPVLETASFINQLPPDMFGLREWEDADILAQVLAASQQEYLDHLKMSKDDVTGGGAGGAAVEVPSSASTS